MSELSTATAALALATNEMKEAKESFENALSDINQRATEAIQVLGSSTVNYYVDPVNGNDSNSGTSLEASFASLDKAMAFAIAPALTGSYIYIHLKGSFDYHINKDFEVYNRFIQLQALSSLDKPNIYIDPKVVSSTYKYFGTYGVSLFNSGFTFHACDIYLPVFSDIENHDRVLTSSQGGIFRPVPNSYKQIHFSACELHVGDQWVVVPSPGDNTMLNFSHTDVYLRAGRTTDSSPILLNSSTTLTVNFYNSSLNDGLSYMEGSFFDGVRFQNGIATNVLANITIMEPV